MFSKKFSTNSKMKSEAENLVHVFTKCQAAICSIRICFDELAKYL